MAVRGQSIKQRRGRAVMLAACAALAVMAAPCGAAGDPHAALKARIDAAMRSVLGRDQDAELAVAEALKRDIDETPTLEPLWRARFERLYESTLDAVGRGGDAVAAGDRGLALLSAAKLEDSDDMAALLTNRAMSEERQARLDTAITFARRAEAILVALHGKDASELFTVQCEIGRIEMLHGRLGEAIEQYRLGLSHGAPPPPDRINHIINNLTLAILYSRHGDDDQVLRYGRQAFEEAKLFLPEGHRGWGVIYTNLANWLSGAGRLEEAETVVQHAIAYNRERFGATNFDTGASLRTLGAIRWRQGRYEEAEQVYREAVIGLQDPKYRLQNPFLEADAYRGLARVAIARQKPDMAAAAVQSGLESLERNHDHTVFSANLYATLASAQILQGKYSEALVAVDTALVQFRKALAPYSGERVVAELLRAQILSRLGRTAEAWREAKPVVAVMTARLNDQRIGEKGRYTYAQDYRLGFARAADIAAAAGQKSEAFRCAQLSAYSEIAGSSLALAARVAGRDAGAARHIRAMQDLQVAHYHLERERNFALGRDEKAVAALDARLEETSRALDRELAAVERASPAYAALAQLQPASIERARAALGTHEALLVPVQSDDRLTMLVLTRGGLFTHTAPLDVMTAAQAVTTLRSAVEGGAGPFDPAAAWTLGRAVFAAPVLERIKGVKDIAVLGSGALMTVPLSMLLTAPPLADRAREQPYALRRFAFSVRPALIGALAVRPASGKAFLGIGAPQLQGGLATSRGPSTSLTMMRGGIAQGESLRALPSLPGAGGELAAMAKALPDLGSVVLTGKAATELALREQPLARFGVLAFATHGLISGELASLHEPALVLTPPETALASENDGLLTASEIAGLKLDADWVILSACNTGSGLDNGAGGYSGLARGFMQAGARNLLVSLWPVRDDVAAKLSVATVKGHAAGLSRAQALRRAMLAVIADKSIADGGNPAVWAPFSLVAQ